MCNRASNHIKMFEKYFVLILSAIFSAECFVEDYRFVSEMNGYLKLHRYPEKWQDARLRCHLEGGVLASPTNPQQVSIMTAILANANKDRIYTGIHATYSSGDFTTITGIPLSKMSLEWERDESNNSEKNQNCVIMYGLGVLADVNCDTEHPYMCYKSMGKFHVHKCHPEFAHSDYKFDNRTGSCYKFHKEGRTWPDAFKTCMAEDAYLAIMNSDLESTVIKQLFEQYPSNAIPGDHQKDGASIGFTLWREIGEWFTIHGDSLADAGFSTFNSGEPNNADHQEWCGSVWRNGLLNDHNCDKLLTFICEKSPSHDEHNDHQYILQT